MKKILILMTFFLGTAQAGLVKINSNPSGAEIFVKDTQSKKQVKIGTTPFSIELDQLINSYANSDVFLLQLNKEGFSPYRILLSKTGDNNIDLAVNLEVNKNIKEIQKIDRFANQLFEVQRLLRVQNFDAAINKLNGLEKDYPNYSVIYELAGSAYYLNKKFSKSLSYYRKAFATNSENVDAYRMKMYLEEKLNIKGDAK